VVAQGVTRLAAGKETILAGTEVGFMVLVVEEATMEPLEHLEIKG
jgi:hypothetical protein